MKKYKAPKFRNGRSRDQRWPGCCQRYMQAETWIRPNILCNCQVRSRDPSASVFTAACKSLSSVPLLLTCEEQGVLVAAGHLGHA